MILILSIITFICWWELCFGRLYSIRETEYPKDEDIYEAYQMTSNIQNETAREILSQYMVFCPGQDMCHGDYLKRRYEFDLNPSCTPCECDDSCMRRSTCCPSKFLPNENNNEMIPRNNFKKRPSLSCIQPFWNMHSGFYGKSYWIIETCPSGDSCNSSHLQERNISLSTPVTSLSTNESYKNIHCALCHNERISDLIFWKQNQILCNRRSDLLLSKTPDKLLEFVFNPQKSCNVLFYPPSSLEDIIKPCVYVEHVPCTFSGPLDADRGYLIQACDTYHIPYSNCEQTFKNVFCALCERVSLIESLNQMPIGCKDENNLKTNNFKTFSALLDFDEERNRRTPMNNTCALGQIYDYLTGKCLDLTCEKEYVLDQSLDCRPMYTEWGENNYELSMIFRPSFQVDKAMLAAIALPLRSILENKVTHSNLSEYLCGVQIFEFDDNDERYLGALIEFSVNKGHDIDKMFEKFMQVFQKDRTITVTHSLHGYDMNVSSSIIGQVFHLDKDNEHYISSVCRHFVNPMTFTAIFPLSSFEYQETCSEVSTIVVADWYGCPKVKISTEDTKIRLVNYSLCLLDYNQCIPSRYFKQLNSNQQFEVCLDWYNRASNRMFIQKTVSSDVVNIYLSVICLSLSSGGSLLTIISYLVQKEPMNSPGANIVILSVFLFIANTIYTFSNFFLQSEALCLMVGILVHFCWLSVVFWMSLSSFQIFQTFTNITVTTLKRDSNVLCFLLINTLLCLLLIGVNVTISYSLSDGQSLGYSPRTCYIADSKMVLYTFALPVAVTVCINTFMFVVTANRIHGEGDLRKSKDQNKVGAYFRLSTLTGTSWIFGFLAQFTDLQVFSLLHIVFSAGQGIFLYLGFGMPLGIKWKNARKSIDKINTATESVN